MKTLDRELLLQLYNHKKMSVRQLSKKLDVPRSTVQLELKKIGALRTNTQAQANRRMRGLTFTCKLCGETQALVNLVEDHRYFPFIYCCRKCAGWWGGEI